MKPTSETHMMELNLRAQVPALEKSILILDYIQNQERGAALADICRDLHLPKSSAYRIVTTLARHGFLEQGEGSALYCLGYRILVLSKGAIRHSNLARTALPFLRRLAHDVEEAVKLSVLREGKIYAIEKVDSPLRFKISLDAGVYPIHAGGASKLLLAYAAAELQRTVLHSELRKYTENTVTDPEVLRRELERIRVQGWAADNQEYIAGLRAIAYPVRDYGGKVVAAVSIPFLAASAGREREELLVAKLSECAQEISSALGFS